MRTIELSPAEYQALMAFADGVKPSRPIRRRLLQAGALIYARYGDGEPILKLTDSAMSSLVENAPRSKWTPPVRELTPEEQASRNAARASRNPSNLAALAIAAALIGGRR